MKPTLWISRELPKPVIERAHANFDVTLRKDQSPVTQAEAAEALAQYDALLPTLRDDFSKDAFHGPIRAKILANFGVGYNHIDLDAAKMAGIMVTNTPGAVTDATADIAMMLVLMSCRRASEGEILVRAGNWDGWHPTQLLGQHIGGRVLGILGMGRIGKAIARRAHLGFGMDVVFFNRSKVADPGVPARQIRDLAELARVADVIVLALPATAETHHIVGAEFLSKMKPTAHLVNIARGDIVDEAALIAALQSGGIAGAGLDVYENEPIVSPELRALTNVTLLPHLGTAALDVRIDMGMMAIDNLDAFALGRPLPNLL